MIDKIKAVFPQFMESVLHSYSLVFFGKQNLFAITLLAVTFLDVYTGMAGLLATVIASIAAYLIGLNSSKIISGSYGFNSLLVGLGLGIQFQPSLELYIVLVFAALLTLLLTVLIEGVFLKYGFQYNILAGLIIAIGLVIYSRISFLLSLIGFFAAYYFYQFIGANIDELNYSYIGFNFILTAIAMGGFFTIPSKYSFLWVILLTPVISLVISSSTVVLDPMQLPIYSLAFNVVVVLFMYALILRYRSFDKPAITGVQLFKPELNLYYQQNSTERFYQNKYLSIGLPLLGEWTILQGYNGEYTHKEEWQHALDFGITDANAKQYKTSGETRSDYYGYNKPVVNKACRRFVF